MTQQCMHLDQIAITETDTHVLPGVTSATACVRQKCESIRGRFTGWSAPQSSTHREELSVSCPIRYSAGLRVPSAECG